MKTVFSPRHAGHAGNVELDANAIVPAYEKPARAEIVRARVEAVGLGPVVGPDAHDLATARKVHAPAYIDFLPTVYSEWEKAGRAGTAMPYVWPTRGLRGDVEPRAIEARLGFYAFDAGSAFMGGYCYINNAAVAAQRLRDRGAARVSILDIDYHHGNGTQEIFYRRGDVQVVNLHADPMVEYPYFLGHADERGEGAGEGFNHNFPLPAGTAWAAWGAALDTACDLVAGYGPDALVVSLGVDTFERDPISRFRLKSEDYPRAGRRIAGLGLPTLFVMEGGYAVEEIGINAVGVLSGFEDG